MRRSEQFRVAERLRIIRESKGIMQPSFAEALGCSVPRISDIENGKNEYTDGQVVELKILLAMEDAPTCNQSDIG